jgi:hypothetical protein
MHIPLLSSRREFLRSAGVVLGLCAFAVPALRAADDFTAEKAKALIPEAAGMPAEEFQKLAENPVIDNFKSARGDSLTWWMLTYQPGPDTPKNPTSFKFLGESVNPAALANAISGPKDKNGKVRAVSTLIHPEYITDCTCKVDGDTATGTVSFKAEKAYEGKVEYTARKKDGKWRIEEFRLPEFKTTLALGADGKWVKK